ncbi:glycosyltransferase family 4 protein [Mucilaginibacter sp. L3T2-6]|uniref:glycosyltransferase family 4 protein n=1 Tax=Mucilaginibacter sp. L3T2-6 TaxID=3062491 RepID=UPI002675B91E|nr:glycosyltransferase family 4 protein [Mucilaginibacter sp. L3T2-6]MDO3642988.1 glycosyltransferase family 4 protein [Mucilaginibacter sp. L3T2-6]MDV6215313.1 glycosyltransferase family 4 protein [Mucilaginibacter sp. L3T2-6]
MRILLLHQYFLEQDDPGGSRFNELTAQWSELGHEVTVIAGMMHYNGAQKRPEYKGKWFKKNLQGSVTVWRTHVSESYNAGFLGRLWGYFSFVFSAMWAGLFKVKGKHDIILVTSPPLFIGITGYVLSRLKGIPFVFEIRDLWPESAIDTGVVTNKLIIKLAYALERFIYRTAKKINVLTPAFRKTLIEKKNVSPEKIIFIPNAADFSLSDHLLETFDTEAFRKEHGWENKFVVTYVGAHGVANHLEQVLETGDMMRDTNVLFVLIGQGMQKEHLKGLAAKMNVTNVLFLDPVPKAEVFKYIFASDMGTSVLKNVETFKTVYSNKTFDYMACKKPILMAIDGVSRELVEEAGAGVFVEPENPTDFSRKVRQYISNPERIKLEGESGYRFAKENFDRKNLALKYLDYLKDFAKKS